MTPAVRQPNVPLQPHFPRPRLRQQRSQKSAVDRLQIFAERFVKVGVAELQLINRPVKPVGHFQSPVHGQDQGDGEQPGRMASGTKLPVARRFSSGFQAQRAGRNPNKRSSIAMLMDGSRMTRPLSWRSLKENARPKG